MNYAVNCLKIELYKLQGKSEELGIAKEELSEQNVQGRGEYARLTGLVYKRIGDIQNAIKILER